MIQASSPPVWQGAGSPDGSATVVSRPDGARRADTVPSVWEPTGPLPVAVYWRRRALAAAVGVLAVVLGIGVLTGVSPRDEPPQPVVPAAPPATGVLACADGMLEISTGLDAEEHRVGDKPVLRLIVTNKGAQPCVRDLDPTRQEVTVWSADLRERVWSSNDCSATAPQVDQRTLQPNQPLAFPVRWAGRTSAQGCSAQRAVVPPGSYQLLGRLDAVTGAPTAFRRAR